MYRNIPAYAGKTPYSWAVCCVSAEHPRVCGENGLTQNPRVPCLGTSPRMRGKPDLITELLPPIGNIPAYAGKT